MLDDSEGRASRSGRPGLTPTTTATNGPPILPHQGDPRSVGELLAAWVGAKLDEVDGLVDEARAKAEAIPDRRSLMLLLGELTVRLHCLELAVDELRAAKR